MNYRFMRVIVFFDMPTTTAQDKREYHHFHKFLIKSGFMMMQYSVYSKLVLNTTMANILCKNIRKEVPKNDSIIQLLMITEKQYSRMEFLVGEKRSSILDDDRRLVIL